MKKENDRPTKSCGIIMYYNSYNDICYMYPVSVADVYDVDGVLTFKCIRNFMADPKDITKTMKYISKRFFGNDKKKGVKKMKGPKKKSKGCGCK